VPNPAALFTPSENCMACHNGLTAPSGENISIGIAWRSTIMANSSRDPYWQASIRRETIDHPAVAAEIEDECSVCHMPMSHTAEHAAGGKAQVFAHLPVTNTTDPMSLLAHDGVSCTLCHQVTPEKFGDPDSFTGGYVIDTTTRPEQRAVYGPFDIDAGRVNIMHSVTGFKPTQALHIRESELCATCHTLYTVARGASGEAVGRLPEQVPFLEWKHSRYAAERSCQSCHMPVVDQPTPIASVLGQPREGVSRHTFLGGNFFVLRMLNAFRGDLGVVALPEELEAAAKETEAFLQNQAARISLEDVASRPSGLDVRVKVENLTGHKLPTAYPSRRAWIHLVVRDGSGRIVFESGALDPNGSIRGNDNDADPLRFEPHYSRITAPDEVEIYESILVDQKGGVTTGLLQGVTYGKDNRLLPQGFDKTTAVPDIAVHGDAASDATFTGGGDTVEYAIDTHGASGPFVVDAELLYQPIGYRWGSNLQPYTKAPEPARFISYFDSMRAGMTTTLARATSMAPARP
jgi:hypothetical protein